MKRDPIMDARMATQGGRLAPDVQALVRDQARARYATLTDAMRRARGEPALLLTLEVEEPPTVNAMLTLAKRRTRKGPHGVWMQRPQSAYWVAQQEYQARFADSLRQQMAAAGVPWPEAPWPKWRIVSAHYRVHQLRDPLELPAGLKWAADALVAAGLVADDSPRELSPPPAPTQEVQRRNRGVTLTICPEP